MLRKSIIFEIEEHENAFLKPIFLYQLNNPQKPQNTAVTWYRLNISIFLCNLNVIK